MVRNYKPKTDRTLNTNITKDKLKAAAILVKDEGWNIRPAAKQHGVDRMTLTRFIKNNNQFGYKKCSEVRKVFLEDQEVELANHLKALDDKFYGLHTEKCRTLAFDYATATNRKIPPSWTKNLKAGWFVTKQWKVCVIALHRFSSTHITLLRKPVR